MAPAPPRSHELTSLACCVSQLLINYANESLQRHFNRCIFEVEQAEYSREGIDWTFIEVCGELVRPCNDTRPKL
jgi:myosin heavy subunit